MLNEILRGNRQALSKAITLIESSSPSDRTKAHELLSKVEPSKKQPIRIGFSGPPGAGKSTLIESLGQHILEKGHKLAVLAIDPSSQASKGSLLGDKTRMQKLAQNSRVFIRPSPTRGHLGGVTAHTEEVLMLCAAAGFDMVFLESVGVGQSESDISSMVDTLVLVIPPAAGDDLQAIKRGLFELADIIAINKHDGELKLLAEKSQKSHLTALTIMGRNTPVMCVSALTNSGLEELWRAISMHKHSPTQQHELMEQRFWLLTKERLLSDFQKNPELKSKLPKLLRQASSRKISLWQVISRFFPCLIFATLLGCKTETLDTNTLISRLEGDNPRKAHAALIYLTRHPDPKALDAIIAYADKKPASERIQAILAVRQLGDKRAIPWLFVLSNGHPDLDVQKAAQEALTYLKKQAK